MAGDSAQTFQEMKDLRKKLDAHDAALTKAYNQATKDLRGAIDDGSEDEINVVRPKLDSAITLLDQSLDACDIVHKQTAKLLADKAFVATKVDEIKELVKHVALAKNRLSGWASAARKLGEEADKALGTAKKSTKEAEAELGALKNRVKGLQDEINDLKRDIPKLAKDARDANDKGDHKSLERARLTLIDSMKGPKSRAIMYRAPVEQFKKDHPDLERDMKAEVQWLLDTLWDADTTLADGAKTLNELLALKPPAKPEKDATLPEVPKAELLKVAPIVGIDPKDAKNLVLLAKVLNSMPHSKWADGLSRLATQLKLKNINGKAMVTAIDKLPYFKKQQLIDI